MKNELDSAFMRIDSYANVKHMWMFGIPDGEGALSNMSIDIDNLKSNLEYLLKI